MPKYLLAAVEIVIAKAQSKKFQIVPINFRNGMQFPWIK